MPNVATAAGQFDQALEVGLGLGLSLCAPAAAALTLPASSATAPPPPPNRPTISGAFREAPRLLQVIFRGPAPARSRAASPVGGRVAHTPFRFWKLRADGGGRRRPDRPGSTRASADPS